MSASLVVAIPSKGRLQENTNGFFKRAGLVVERPGGDRNYRGRFRGFDDVEIAFLSASEISGELAAGSIHLGVTGLDLVHETMPDAADRAAHVHAVQKLGFGHADVVLAVPDQWIDVETMADLADVAVDFRTRHKSRLRIATKYINLANAFCAKHGVSDYRIVDSAGATEGAPAAGTAEVIVDITTTGSTLRANRLRVLRDGVILPSEAHLVAAKTADWSEPALAAARRMTQRIEAEATARPTRLLTASGSIDTPLRSVLETDHGCRFPFGSEAQAPTVFYCPETAVFDAVAVLQDHGIPEVAVSDPDFAFTPRNALFEGLCAALVDAQPTKS